MNTKSKKPLNLLLVILMLVVLVPTAMAVPPAQEEGQDYIVTKDDWLSKLAEKYLGDPFAYTSIVGATNQMHAKDDSYAQITDPHLIEVGWKLFIPSRLFPILPDVQIIHRPVIATSSEPVTFTATVREDGTGPCTVWIYVNGTLVETCENLSTGDTCVYTGGPYPDHEMSSARYKASITDSAKAGKTMGDYYFAITDGDYEWARDYMPARRVGPHPCKEDFVFHMAEDYGDMGQFVSHVEDKMYSVYGAQDVIEAPTPFDAFNFYVYSHPATLNVVDDYVSDCGTVDARAATDMSWRDDDAILHVARYTDCSAGEPSHFTAEGGPSKTFLHESGHAVFDLADEYDDLDRACLTHYFAADREPNVFDTEAECRAEQMAKRRDPDECWEFTTCQGNWWGIHALDWGTVMQWGDPGQPWGVEARERVAWVFHEFSTLDCLYPLGVVMIAVDWRDARWWLGADGIRVLPCAAPNLISAGSSSQPLIRVLDEEGEVVYQRYMTLDPRIVLTNPPSKAPTFLDKVSFNLRLPLIDGMARLEFYDQPEEQKEPAISVDLREAIAKYQDAGGPDQEASCQDPEYKEEESAK
jgi:hypothetical protein